jgi:hypothetical protein
LTENGTEITDDSEISQIFVNYFASVFSPITKTADRSTDLHAGLNHHVLSFITNETVQNKLSHLNIHKAVGPDEISNAMMKFTYIEMSRYLNRLFRLSVTSGSLPQEWKHANVTPIYKSGGKRLKENYRPISLTSCVCKVLESLVLTAMHSFLSTNCPLSDSQYGFRQSRSCTSQLLGHINDLTDRLENGNLVDTVYLDFSKAFDKVVHYKLINKLRLRRVPDLLINWIVSFLSNRTQSVVINGAKSQLKLVTSGVPQGSVMGPLLFLLYTDDIDQVICEGVTIRKYADDIKLFCAYENQNSIAAHAALQSSLDGILRWSEENSLPLNLRKCCTMYFGTNNESTAYSIGQFSISITTCERDLGVLIDRRLKFDKHITNIIGKARLLVGQIFRSFASRSVNIIMPAFLVLVRPILEYASPVWNPSLLKHIKALESVQRRVTKRLLGLQHLPYEDRLRALGMSTLSARRNYLDLIELFKITHGLTKCGNVPRPVRSAYTTRGHCYRLKQEKSKLNARRFSFFFRIVKSWNTLPSKLVDANSLSQFKSNLHRYMLA